MVLCGFSLCPSGEVSGDEAVYLFVTSISAEIITDNHLYDMEMRTSCIGEKLENQFYIVILPNAWQMSLKN